MPISLKLCQKIQEDNRLPNSFHEARMTLIPKPGKDKQRNKTIGQYP